MKIQPDTGRAWLGRRFGIPIAQCRSCGAPPDKDRTAMRGRRTFGVGRQPVIPLFMVIICTVMGGVTVQAQSKYKPYLFQNFAGNAAIGSAARFYFPTSVAIDKAGNIYVADAGNHTIRKVNQDGAVETFAGSGSPGNANGFGRAAQFDFPQGVAINSGGNVYVADTYNHTVRKITPAGEVRLFAGLAGQSGSANGTGTGARFNLPQGVAVDSGGNVYVADTHNHTIRKITPAGEVSLLAGLANHPGSANGMGSNARFKFPTSVAVDSSGNVYVADSGNDTIRKITPAGAVSTPAGLANHPDSTDGTGNTARFNRPEGVAVDKANNVYVADTLNNTVRMITPGRVVTTLVGLARSPGSADGALSGARFNGPQGLVIDSSNNIFLADAGNNTIRSITSVGVVNTVAGLAGGHGTADTTVSGARFMRPFGAATDTAGNVYIADTDDNTIRKISPSGVVRTLAGLAGSSGSVDGIGSGALFGGPTGVAVDRAGNVYVAEADMTLPGASNCNIRKITPDGVVTTLAGSTTCGSPIDDTGAAARFDRPNGVAVDSAGNVYVADTYNCVIRKITPDGVVATLAGSTTCGPIVNGTGTAAQFDSPAGVAVDGAGNIYVADTGNNAIRKITPAGVVKTLAGGSFGHANGTGSAAQFFAPSGVAVDGMGNIYVADTDNLTIRKITPGGVVTTPVGLAGNAGSADGTGSAARFNYPQGVAADNAGNIYVADTNNNNIRKITSGNVVSTLAGMGSTSGSTDGTGSAARFNDPIGVAMDNAGNFYIADTENDTIRKITAAGVVSTLAGLAGQPGNINGTGSAARFNSPWAVAVDQAGNVYVADTGNLIIRKITPGGKVTTFFKKFPSFVSPHGIAIDNNNGNVYVADFREVYKITSQRAVSALPFGFDFPEGVAVDSEGNIYVTDLGKETVSKITPDGMIHTLAGLAFKAGSADGTGSAARFYGPQGVAVDSKRNIYVADTFNSTIRKITPGGAVTTLAGFPKSFGNLDGLGSAARFWGPVGITVGSDGSVYVVDPNNNSIRVGTPPPFINSPPFASCTAGLQFIYQIEATGATSFGADNLPLGLKVDKALGIIYGIPTQAGTFDVTITASDSQHTTTATLTIVIQSQSSSGPLSGAITGRTGRSFTFQVLTTSSSTQFSATGLPPGLSINSMTGLISGVPTVDGSFPVTVKDGVSDSTLQFTFTSDPTVPVINCSGICSNGGVTLVVGEFFSYTLTADAAGKFSYIGTDGLKHQGATCVGLPSGLCFDGVATISGTYTGSTTTNEDTILGSVASVDETTRPNTLNRRPPLICQLIANESSNTGTSPLNFSAIQAGSSTSVVSSTNPSASGQAVTFTATVKSATSGVPTGTVRFKDGTAVLGTGSLSSGKATFTKSTLSVGKHSITAVYDGDANFTGSASPVLTQTVNP